MYFEDPKDTIKAELVEDLDLVSPIALHKAFAKVYPNLIVSSTDEVEAQQTADREAFCILAKKFMEQ